jgi:hypothetical protein
MDNPETVQTSWLEALIRYSRRRLKTRKSICLPTQISLTPTLQTYVGCPLTEKLQEPTPEEPRGQRGGQRDGHPYRRQNFGEKRDKVMAFWRTMSGKQTRFLSEAGTKKEKVRTLFSLLTLSQVAISMAGIAKPTKDFRFNVKSVGKTRVWNGTYEWREPTGKSTCSIGFAEAFPPLDSLSVGKSWTKDGVHIEANGSIRLQHQNQQQGPKPRAKDQTEDDPSNPKPPKPVGTGKPAPNNTGQGWGRNMSYECTVALRTSVWWHIFPPLLLSITRRANNNRPNTFFRAGVQVPYANDNRSVMLEGSWKPEGDYYSGRIIWFWNPRSFVGVEASNKRSCFAFVGTPFITPNNPYFQGRVWKELRMHMLMFTTLGVRNGDPQFGLHMTWK